MKRKTLVTIICIVLAVFLVVPISFAWFSDSLNTNTQIETYVHKSYFESGDGTAARQYQTYDNNGDPIIGIDPETGEPLTTQEGCAFEIKYPVQLYYFAWLQALGYFNSPNSDDDTIGQIYFYLSDDLDMKDWVLPQIGTQTYPFVGNFNGNGHTISNLRVRNVEGSGIYAWTDKPSDIDGLNIVGFFGVIGSLYTTGENADTVNGAVADGSNFVPTAGYTYDTSVNEVKDFVIKDATIQTDLSNSLAGIAAGYVNGKMENVKVVGGTLSSTATESLSYTTNLSDYGAVGFCTNAYKDTNNVTTVILYDPQVYSNAQGSASGQDNNWGDSINMKSMYEDLLDVYQGYATQINSQQAGKNIITIEKTDGEVTGVTVTGDGTAQLRTMGYNLKVVEKKDGSDTISYFSLVERSTNFMYLYGGTTYTTQDINEDAFYIHTGENTPTHYLSMNNVFAITDSNSQGNDAKWIIKDGKIYTIRSKTITDPESNVESSEDYFYYLIKNGNNELEIVEVSQLENTPTSVTDSLWTVGDGSITIGEYALIYSGGSWTLSQISLFISDNAENNYLSASSTPSIVNQTSSSNATQWTKESIGGNSTGFYLATIINGTKYYLLCDNSGILSIGTSNPTIWNEDAPAVGNHKVYALTGTTSGYALYYDISNGWSTTSYSTTGQGSDWGGSIDMYNLYSRLRKIYDNYAVDSGNHIEREITYLDSTGNTINIEKIGISGEGYFKGYYSTTADYSYVFNKYDSSESMKDFMYLYGDLGSSITSGEATIQHVSKQQASFSSQQFELTYSEEVNCYYITCTVGGIKYYLANSGSSTTTAVTNQDGASIWYQETISGQAYFLLYTYVDGNARYLVAPASNGKASLANRNSTSNTQQFYIENGNQLYYMKNNAKNYFYYDPNNKYGARWTTSSSGKTAKGVLEAFSQINDYYFSIDNFMNLSSETNSAKSTPILYHNNKLFLVINNNLYYLIGSSSGVVLSEMISESNATNWNISSSGISFSSGGTTYYLNLSPVLGVSTSPQSIVVYNNQTINLQNVWKTIYVGDDTIQTAGTNGFPGTYFPLSVSKGTINQTQSFNTGYIVSGKESASGTESQRTKMGDIRVSKYPMTSLKSVSTVYTINNNGKSQDKSNFEKYDSARAGLDDMFTEDNEWVYGLHFMNASISASDTVTIPSAIINGNVINNYVVPKDCIDFHLKEKGYINFFAGTYFSVGGVYENDSFFSLHKINRDNNNNITSITEINTIYKKTDGTYEYNSQSAGSTLVFNTSWLTNPSQTSWENNALYYFEIPVNAGEYALGSVPGKNGAYLLYLDISAASTVEGDSKIINNMNVTDTTDAGQLSYTELEPTENETPTYFPLAWKRFGEGNNHDYRGDIPADTNTGYVISGSNTSSAIPGDIRVSQYSKYAAGNWASIRSSLTSQNNAGILNDSAVYTIIDGEQTNISEYGIGKIHTMQYGSVSKTVNELLEGNQYVYGLHFMKAQISIDKTVTVPKAIINGVTKTNYVMPQDSIDFKVSTKGRIAFMAGTYYSGSSGVQSFFSLHRIFRDGNDNIISIKQLSEIYTDGDASHGYIYRYKGDSGYYNADGTLNGNSIPSGYTLIYDLRAIDNPTELTGNGLTQNSVYYFEIPVDAGEYALGSSDSDGAYLIYLDIAAGASFAVQTTTKEVSEQNEYEMTFPKGVAFVDDANSTAFNDGEGNVDSSKSVFISIPVGANSNGNTSFDITSDGAMTVTADSSLSGYAPQSIPVGTSLSVNGSPATMPVTRKIITEKVTVVSLDLGGTTTTTITTTVQTIENGVTNTVVTQTVTTEFNGVTTTQTTNPAPTYDGHELLPKDMTSNENPQPTADIILEYSISGDNLTHLVARNGELVTIETTKLVQIDDKVYSVYNVENGNESAGRYDFTISGTAGSYNVNVNELDSHFDIYINGTKITSTGSQNVTVTATP